MTDLGSVAAATSAKYARIQTDRGAGRSPRYVTQFQKWQPGADGDPGYLDTHEGESDTSQAAADTAALNALNGARNLRYGTGATPNKSQRPAAAAGGTRATHSFDA
jgi:hypothetical protein